jgi:PQQ-like domain/Putative Ig domain
MDYMFRCRGAALMIDAGMLAFTLMLAMLTGCGGSGSSGPSAPTGPVAPSGLSYTSPQTYTVGVAISPLSPTVTGTVTSYSIAPSLPAGLSIDATTGQITGTPIEQAAAAVTEITALNDGGSTTFELTITVNLPAPTGLVYPNPQIFLVGTPITPLVPTVTGTVAQYSVAPALPSGLSMDAATGEITGTPDTATPSAPYVIMAQNSGGSTTFTLTITVLMPPPSALTYPSPQDYITGVAITPLVPTVTGVVAQFSVTPALPAGLMINATTGQISGTPTTATPAAEYVIMAQNSAGSTTFALFITVQIPAPSALSYPSPQIFTQGKAIALLIPTVTGAVTTYSSVPALPAGIAINAGTGQISGTPSTPSAATGYTIYAANSTGNTAFVLTITVLVAPPSALTYRSPQSYVVGTAIIPLNPSVTGVVASYGVAPALPAGLALNTATGQISGTPTSASATATYMITAANSTGSTTFGLSIQVLLLAPNGLTYTSPQVYAVGTTIAPLNPTVVGPVTSYTVAPALPIGLSINAVSGQITGTPTVAAAAANYLVTATNAAGSASFNLSIAVATVGVSPASISRIMASGTPLTVLLTLTSTTLAPSGTLYAVASDPSGVFNPAVTVTPGSTSGIFTLALAVSPTPGLGIHTGNLTIDLCADAACTMPETPASIAVPYTIDVLSTASAWPGNNVKVLSPWPGVPDWAMFQGNAAHTGFVPVTLDPNIFSTRWLGPILDQQFGYNSTEFTLTTSYGQIYIGYGTTLYALKELDATAVWQFGDAGMGYPSINPPSVANGVVYVAAGQQTTTFMYGFNAVDGSMVFKSPMSSQWEHYLAPTIGANGIYTNAGEYGGLYGFNPAGKQLFFTSLNQESEWTPAVDANHVYAYAGIALTVVDPLTGAVQDSIPDPTFAQYTYMIGGSTVLGAPGSVFAANYTNAYINGGDVGNSLLDFNVTSSSVAWHSAGDYLTTPAYNGGIVYAANNNPLRLEALAESNGAPLWTWTPQAGDTTFASEVLLTNNMAFVSTNLAVYGIDLNTHLAVWSYPGEGLLALSQNGILYIQGAGQLIAINVK